MYDNIWSYLSGRVTGLVVSENNVLIRGNKSLSLKDNNPLFLIDGCWVDKLEMDYLTMNNIDKIEVLKSGGTSAIFGMQGANGVIAIYTKLGASPDQSDYEKGILRTKLRGYYG